MKMNRCSRRIEINNRTFEIRFWEEYGFCYTFPYVEVVEILPKKHWWNAGTENVAYTVTDDDRVEWAMKKIQEYLEEEKEILAEREKVRNFCENP